MTKSVSLSLSGSQNSGAEGADELGINCQWCDVNLKHAFEFHKETLVFRAAAGHGEAGFKADALDEGEAALCHSVLNARGDIGRGIAFGQQADHLRLGKHAALGCYRDRLSCIQ